MSCNNIYPKTNMQVLFELKIFKDPIQLAISICFKDGLYQ